MKLFSSQTKGWNFIRYELKGSNLDSKVILKAVADLEEGPVGQPPLPNFG